MGGAVSHPGLPGTGVSFLPVTLDTSRGLQKLAKEKVQRIGFALARHYWLRQKRTGDSHSAVPASANYPLLCPAALLLAGTLTWRRYALRISSRGWAEQKTKITGWFRNLVIVSAGPKGLRAESARAVTGRRCPHSGVGEDFLGHRPSPLTKTGVTRERKVVD